MRHSIMRYSYLFITLLCLSQLMYSMEDLMIMMGAQEGASLDNQAINQTFQNINQSITKIQSTLESSIAQLTNTMQTVQAKEMSQFEQLFAQAQKHVQSEQSNQTLYFQQMNDYISKAIDLQKPTQYYLLNKSAYLDELFSLSTMYTPQGPIWKNIFGVGNWEYDHITDTFWQMQNVPFEPQSSHSILDKQYHQAANSIFTEYFTTESSYEIVCELTIHQVQYPFFVGIEFNRTRWISGDFDSITKCRLLGIYGASQNNIGTYFSEQYDKTVSVNTTEKGTTTLYPLDQIIQQQIQPDNKLTQQAFENTQHQPVVILIKIKTSPSIIQYKLWEKGTDEPKKFITKKSKNKDLYLYHNIGFITSGTIAQFKLLQPTQLLFSEDAKKIFASEVNTLLSPPKHIAQQKTPK